MSFEAMMDSTMGPTSSVEHCLTVLRRWSCHSTWIVCHHGLVLSAQLTGSVETLESLLLDRQKSIAASLQKLPAEIEQPVSVIHDLIDNVSRQINLAFKLRDHTTEAYDLQRDLPQKFHANIPEFLPFDTNLSVPSRYVAATVMGWRPSDTATKVHMKEVIELVQRYMSPRDRILQLEAIRSIFITQCATTWKETSEHHVIQVWTSTKQSITTLIGEVCKDHPLLEPRIR